MVFKLRKYLPLLIAIVLLTSIILCAIVINGGSHPLKHNETENVIADSGGFEKVTPENGVYLSHSGEMKAVWVPYMTLTLNEDKSEKAFKEKFDKIIETAKKYKMNTLIVHLRPFADALYPSEYYPWSHILTGTQGTDPKYDPLKYMVDASHKANLEFHAWINPLRIKTEKTPKSLSSDNIYNKWIKDDDTKNCIIEWKDEIYFNPAESKARQLIIDGIREIVKKYAVDGIQFDDYFYPTTDSDFDKTSYNEYLESLDNECQPLALLEWRQANINTLISGVYCAIHNLSDNVVFGISPQGNINNDLEMGADVEKWCSEKGYIDYICPQIYVNFDHALLPYDSTAEKWKELIKNSDIKYYIGLAVYKAGSEEDDGTWLKSEDILKKEIEYGRDIGADGFMLYSLDYLQNEQTQKEIENAMNVL